MMGSPAREGHYTPVVPSPLNPTNPQRPTGPQRRGSYSRTASRKPGAPVSPTQRLMRQKAAAAWRSLAFKSEIPSITSAQIVKAAKPEVVEIARRQSFASEETHFQDQNVGMGDLGEQLVFVDAFDGGNMGLGIISVGSEKQPLIGNHGYNTVVVTGAYDALPTHEQRPRRPRILTRQRLSLAVGILCIVGVLSASLSRQ
ncbi:hypothetical protein SCUP234_07454 [Seiridium cupressi]